MVSFHECSGSSGVVDAFSVMFDLYTEITTFSIATYARDNVFLWKVSTITYDKERSANTYKSTLQAIWRLILGGVNRAICVSHEAETERYKMQI